MTLLTEKERQLLDKLAAEGRAMTLYTDDLKVAHALEDVQQLKDDALQVMALADSRRSR
jgi:hypothetical protein